MAYTSINKPTDYFNTVLYTGNGGSQSITGVNFRPDWIWIKNRDDTDSSNIFDSVRGSTKVLFSDQTTAEINTGTRLTSFDTDGFSINSTSGQINFSGEKYASWNWLASNTTASNTQGSITSTVSANTTSGFSIVTFTTSGGSIDTIGHGLGVAPSMIILKSTTNVNNWSCYHKSLGNNKEILLNGTGASSTNTIWNNTTPTSTIFNLNLGNFGTSRGAVAYCFAEKKGFSKFGSYTGNGSTDGTFVYTGFKPAFVITKCSSTSSSYTHWGIWDNKRDPKNQAQQQLAANISDEENSSNIGGQYIDMLSNGFKTRNNGSSHNLSGETYIYMAFAESPFTTSTGVPTTAR